MMMRRQNPGLGISVPSSVPSLGLASLTFLVFTGAAWRARGFQMRYTQLHTQMPR